MGCGKIFVNNINENRNEESENSMKNYEMTQEQMEILCDISINKEKVKIGDLANWQIVILNQYDYAMKYLETKYPSYRFQITACDPKNKMNSYTTFTFVEKSEIDIFYTLYIDAHEENENAYIATDNFYGRLFGAELANKLQKLVCGEFPECVGVTTNITCVEGEKFGENFDLNLVLNGECEMEHDTDFYFSTDKVAESEYLQIVGALEKFIREKGIYGSYDVKFVDELNFDSVLYREHFFINGRK